MNLEDLERQYNLPPGMLNAVMQTESNGNPNAVGPVTSNGQRAMGAFQFMPATAQQYGVDPTNLDSSAQGAARYLADLSKQNGGDIAKTLASYNWGPGNVAKKGLDAAPPETQKYIQKVSGRMDLGKVVDSLPDVSPQPDAAPAKATYASAIDSLPDISAQKPNGEDVAKSMMLRGMLGGQLFGTSTPDVAMGALQVPTAIAQMISRAFNGGQSGAVDDAAKSMQSAYDQAAQPQATPVTSGLGRSVGQALATAPILPTLAPEAGLIKSAALGAGTGAAADVLTPTLDDSKPFLNQKLAQAGSGAALGALTGGVGGIVGRALSPNVSADVKQLMGAGVTPTPGQVMGGLAQTIENKATSIPLLGDAIQAGRVRGLDQFNKAAYARALAPLGDEGAAVAESAPVGSEGIAKIGDFLSQKYNEVLPKITVVRDPQFDQQAQQLRQMVNTSLPTQQAQQFNSILDNQVLGKFTDSGLMSGQTMKQVESTLGSISKGYKGFNNDFDKQQLGDAVRQLQSNLRDAVARSSPDNAPTVQAINQGWANLTQLENAGSMLGAKNGIFSPAQYLNAVKKSDLSVRDRAFARGQARNQDLATAGDNVLSNRYPDPGTAGRALLGMGLGGGLGMMNPAIPAAGAVASLAYTPMVQKAIAGLLAGSRGQTATTAGDALKRIAPYLGFAAPAGLLGH